MSEEKHGKKILYSDIWRMVRSTILPWRWHVLFTMMVAVIVSGLFVFEPYLYGKVIDSATVSVANREPLAVAFAAIVPLLVMWAGITLVSSLLIAVHAWFSWYVGNRFEQTFGEKMFAKTMTLDVQHFQDERAGAMLHRFATGKEALWRLSATFLKTIVPCVTAFIIITTIGIVLDWRLTLAALTVVPIEVFIGLWHMRVSHKHQNKLNEQWEETDGIVGDAFANVTTVKSAAGEGRVLKNFAKVYLGIVRTQLKVNISWATIDSGSSLIFSAGRFVIFVVGIRLVFLGQTSLGTMITFLGLATALYSNVQQIFGDIPELGRALSRLNRLAIIWNKQPAVQDDSRAIPARVFNGEIIFDRVSYAYENGRAVLSDVSFTIAPGKKLAIVGESGAGKSTLAKLMIRFADPKRGEIRIDGKNIRTLTLETFRPQIGFVMQENLLFHESILANLKFGKPNATRKQVEDAARRAQAHDFITKLPKGYDTVVGERGVKLSGGQKQRIALARVLLANPPILVLDEATSALDSKTEHDLQMALRETMKNRTSIVIAHRLSTVMDADNILVMDKGRIINQGKHEQLIRRGGLYKQYWEIQAGGYV